MPRLPTGIYEQPFPDVITASTIESTVYNGFVNDVETDLNAPRPIVAGGTGADDADEALANLSGEKATQLVTNYDTHLWMPGSFRSAVGATGAQNSTDAFAGIVYINEPLANPPTNQNVVIEARNLTTDMLSIRKKTAGVWGGWQSNPTTAGVVISPVASSAVLYLNKPVGAFLNVINASRNNLTRWQMHLGNSTTETGTGNTGSDFAIVSHNDAGTVLSTVMTIARSNSAIGLFGATTITGNLTTTGPVTTGDNIICNGNSVYVSATPGVNGTYYIRDGVGATKVSLYWDRAGNNAILANAASGAAIFTVRSDATIELATGFRGREGMSGGTFGSVHNFYWTGSIQAWINTSNVGIITLTSDYRIKKDVSDLPGMWETVKALRPIKYTQAQYTPQIEIARRLKEAAAAREQAVKDGVEPLPADQVQPMFPADDIERWGFVAHELQETMIESAATGYKDAPDIVQSPNQFTLIAALTKALQEAMARIEALEAVQTP